MPEFFVYTCRECRRAYAGALEITDRVNALEDRLGLCGDCLELLVGWCPADQVDEEVESREDNSGTPPNA